jgi:DNA-binding MarR family transcriptional regulator
MSGEAKQRASKERVHQLLEHLEEIVPRLTMMPPEMRSHLVKQLDRVHPRFSPRLVAEPPTMHRIAGMLYRDPKPTMGELSKELSLPLSTVSRIVDTLEEQGFAKRLPDADDGRVVRVGLTETGRQIYEAMLSHGMRNAGRVLDCLTPEEQIILLTLLGKVASNLKKET